MSWAKGQKLSPAAGGPVSVLQHGSGSQPEHRFENEMYRPTAQVECHLNFSQTTPSLYIYVLIVEAPPIEEHTLRNHSFAKHSSPQGGSLDQNSVLERMQPLTLP